MEASPPPQSPSPSLKQQRIISFNCGGVAFDTTLSTLTSAGENLLSKLATTEVGVLRDKKGRIFLDRSPTTFALVLEFLRCGTTAALDAGDATTRAMVDAELRFFCITGLPNQQTSDSTIRQALSRAHTRFVDSWLEVYDETARRVTDKVVADLQELANSRRLISTRQRCSTVWYCSAALADDPAFPDRFGPKKARLHLFLFLLLLIVCRIGRR
jgi:predicted ATPase